jgi:hypothetical protein
VDDADAYVLLELSLAERASIAYACAFRKSQFALVMTP